MYAWTTNDRGQGLLKLDRGWNRDRAAFEKVKAEIHAAGWQIDDHDKFWAVIDGNTYYQLSPRERGADER